MSSARYSIGIDLGTTHCVLAAVDLSADNRDAPPQQIQAIPQLTAPGAIEERALLPAFLYVPHADELRTADRVLPWTADLPFVLGELARNMGEKTPLRLVSSAKSWLCHPGVDRRAALLPINAPDEVPHLSPLSASMHYLEHLRAAWDLQHPQAALADQEVVLTVPASFDPAARELTAEAAELAGIKQLVLLEEPQAALYHWILSSGGAWRKQVKVGDIILVVDLGGGTTDFSLIAVTERAGALELVRIAVGDHILLGGDNMDLALAHTVRSKMEAQGTHLEPWQVQGLAHACRNAKELLLHDASLEQVPLVIPSRGSRLISGTLRSTLTRAEVHSTLLEGFFPLVASNARPALRARAALTKLGLPYAQDAAMTKHLAAFLCKQAQASADLPGFHANPDHSFLHPTAVLFNGGVFKADTLLQRTLQVLNGWLAAEHAPAVRLLTGLDLDLAVAQGAAYYGYVRRGGGVRIRGGTAKSYYVGVESAAPTVPGMEPPVEALCIAPFGMEEGTQAALPAQEVGLVVGEPVRFRFFSSSVRRSDQVGAVLEQWSADELEELEELVANLPAAERQPGSVVAVRLHAAVTEVGTLRLEALPRVGTETWQVELQVRRPD